MDNSRSTGRVVAVVLGAVLCSVVAATSTADVAQAAAAAGPALVRPAAATAVPTDVSPAKVAIAWRSSTDSTFGQAVYVRGGDGRVWWRPVSGATGAPIGDWRAVPGEVGSGPDVLTPEEGQSVMVARSTSGHLLARSFTATEEGSGWYDFGGYLTSAPVIAQIPGGGLIAVFARGGDGAVWYRLLRNGGWEGWRSLGGTVTSAPDAWSPGEPSGFTVLARGTDGKIWKRTLNGSNPAGGWTSTRIVSTSAPSQGRSTVHGDPATWIRGTSGDLYEAAEGYQHSYGGTLTSAPDALGFIVAVRGPGNAVWTYAPDRGWHALGGYAV